MQEDDIEDEVEDVTPPRRRRRNTNTTRGRNVPLAPPAVLGFGGGPYDLSMLLAFGKHVADGERHALACVVLWNDYLLTVSAICSCYDALYICMSHESTSK
jgi:hypothetical protein